MHSNEGGSVSTYPHRPKVEALCNTVDVVARLRDPTDQLPKPNMRTPHVLSPTITQDVYKRCIATRGESVSTYPRRPKAEALSNMVDVVERLRDPTD